MNHLVSDFIIRIKNAAFANRKQVLLPYSKINKAIGEVLVRERFLSDIQEEELEGKKVLVARIKYEDRLPMFTNVRIVSRPSLRVYAKSKNVSKMERKGQNTAIISTNQGVMTGKEAISKGVGGELLFEIF